MDLKTHRKGMLHELKNGFSIDLTEEEYNARLPEIRKIAEDLYVNMDVLDVLEKDYKLKLLVLSIASWFGFHNVTGKELLAAAHLHNKDDLNPMKFFFMKAGWAPYYLEYEYVDEMGIPFHEVIDTFYADVEFYMDMSDQLKYVRLPNALRIV